MGLFKSIGKALTSAVGGTPLGMAINGAIGLLGSAFDNSANKKIAQMNYDAQMQTNASNQAIAESTNKANLDIAQMNNDYNRENLEMQNQWNLEQWERQNAYNDPSAAASRLLAAGINPANSGLDGAGTAQTIQSAVAAPASDAGRQEAYQLQAPRMDYSVNTFSQGIANALTLTETSNKRYDTQERMLTLAQRMDEAKHRIELMKKQGKNVDFQTSILKLQENLFADTYNDQAENIRLQAAETQERINNMIADTAKKEAETEYQRVLPDLQREANQIEREKIAQAAKAAILDYKAKMASVAAQNYATGMSMQMFQKEDRRVREQTFQNYLLELRRLGVSNKQANTSARALKLDMDKFDYSKTFKGWIQQVLGPAVGGAAGAAIGVAGSKGKPKVSKPGATYPGNASVTLM